MKTGQAGGVRARNYDRSANSQSSNYVGASNAPHALTVRYTYTVASGKKALIGSAEALLIRDGAAATPGLAQAHIVAVTATGSGGFPCVAYVVAGTVGAGGSMSGGQGQILLAGDQLIARDIDASGDGTTAVHMSHTLTEFTA